MMILHLPIPTGCDLEYGLSAYAIYSRKLDNTIHHGIIGILTDGEKDIKMAIFKVAILDIIMFCSALTQRGKTMIVH